MIKHLNGPELNILNFKWSLCGMVYDSEEDFENVIIKKKNDITCERCLDKVRKSFVTFNNVSQQSGAQ